MYYNKLNTLAFFVHPPTSINFKSIVDLLWLVLRRWKQIMWNCWDIVKFFIAFAKFQIAPFITTPHQIPVSLLNQSAVKSYAASSIFFHCFIQSTFLEVTGPVIPELVIQTNSNYEKVLQSIGMRGSGHVVGGILGKRCFKHNWIASTLSIIAISTILAQKARNSRIQLWNVFSVIWDKINICYKIEQDYTMWPYSKLE